ncbi:MAG: signal peptidase I [Spirochaetales bacterium]|nr:signal peptidase I [Spirochaetales bacterium]
MIRNIIVHYGGIAAAVLTAAVLWFSSFDILQVQEISMEPSLHNGQTILVNKFAYRVPLVGRDNPYPGDIVVFQNPFDHKLVVKRVKLSAGDPVVVDSEGWLIAGGERYFLTGRQREMLEGITEVPANSIMVLGDNPFHSVDSRDYGFIPVEAILGRVIQKGVPLK